MEIINNNDQPLFRLTDIQTDDLPPIERLHSTLSIYRATLQKLREDVTANPFANPQDEINFFKKVKPYVVSKMIFEIEYYNLLRGYPKESVEDQLTYFRYELLAIRRFFARLYIISNITSPGQPSSITSIFFAWPRR